MSVFSLEKPLSQYDISSNDWMENNRLGWLGYNAQGEQNAWGKISSWIPALGVGMNLAARGIANKNGAQDTLDNLKEDTDNRLMKTAVGVGVGTAGLGIAGGLGAFAGTGFGGFLSKNAFDLAKTGLGMSANFGGQLAFDQEYNDLGEQDYIYR